MFYIVAQCVFNFDTTVLNQQWVTKEKLLSKKDFSFYLFFSFQ